MAKPLDNDLRKRIVGTMREVECCRAVARRLRTNPKRKEKKSCHKPHLRGTGRVELLYHG